MIRLCHVSRDYGSKRAVDDLHLEAPAGELLAFLGQNGAGKTTTIKMIVGLLQPTEGEVYVCDIDVAKRPREANQLVGYVPDQPFLYEKLSGREFLQFVADIYNLPPRDAQMRIDLMTDTFGLADFLDRLTGDYSHGMKQRLVFASALIHRPKVLVVDEPMVGLDPRSARLVKDLLRRQAEQGTTVFMSTHTLPMAEEIAHRIGVIDGGRLIFLGGIDDLRRQLQVEGGSLERLYLALTEAPSVLPAHAGSPSSKT